LGFRHAGFPKVSTGFPDTSGRLRDDAEPMNRQQFDPGSKPGYFTLSGSKRRFSIGFQRLCDPQADCKSALQNAGIS